jgi:hypothetical protein
MRNHSTPFESDTRDIYGQIHPLESPDLLDRKLQELEATLDKLPTKTTANLTKAKEKCPELLDDDFQLLFLRCEVFDADVSLLGYFFEGKRIYSFSYLFFISSVKNI